MAIFQKRMISILILQMILLVFVFEFGNGEDLKLDFYKRSCPQLESIVQTTTHQFISIAPSLAAALLRLHFHDCFVRGCDGSVLLNSTRNNKAEKDASNNISLRGFQVIDAVKSALENKCPGVVSCADILALVARDAVLKIHGPFWPVPLGRRDGRVSIDVDALNHLPGASFDFAQLKATFKSKGLNVKDLVVLSGGHTIGVSHCTSFSNRLYNFTSRGGSDPSMDPKYIVQLKRKCNPGDYNTLVEMDPGSAKEFDTSYYTMVIKRRGLFESDAALLDDQATKTYVELQATSEKSTFFNDFAVSMVKMGKIGVLKGNAGEIRKHCALVN